MTVLGLRLAARERESESERERERDPSLSKKPGLTTNHPLVGSGL